jgi:hypothetical protein
MELVDEFGDNAEIRASAPDAKEQIRMIFFVGGYYRTVSDDYCRLCIYQNAVDRSSQGNITNILEQDCRRPCRARG